MSFNIDHVVITVSDINKSIDLTNSVDINEIIKFKNWIELKKFSNQIFSKINLD